MHNTKHTKKARAKIREGVKRSMEQRKATRMVKGYWTHPEIVKRNVKNLGTGMLGKKHSIESLEKMKQARLKNPIRAIGKNNWKYKHGLSQTKEYNAFIVRRRQLRKLNNGGSHTFAEWELLKAQYNWTCPACQRKEPEIKLSQDHIIPVSRGGSDNIENIQPLCRNCNSKKSTKIIKYG